MKQIVFDGVLGDVELRKQYGADRATFAMTIVLDSGDYTVFETMRSLYASLDRRELECTMPDVGSRPYCKVVFHVKEQQ